MTSGPLVIIGDSLLDQDWTGLAHRLAPDAPVPVVEVDQVWLRPGGAALTALLAARYGSPVILLTALADDAAGETITALLHGLVDVVRLPLQGGTPTKTRVSAAAHPLVRIDRGNGVAAAQPLPRAATRLLAGAGAVIVSDYGRGVSGLPGLVDTLASQPAPVLWDPHPKGAPIPRRCSLVTPNAAEAQALAGTSDPAEVRRRWEAAAVAITCGADGARLADADGVLACPVPADLLAEGGGRRDTCGAGDQLVAAAGEVLRTGGSVREAVVAGVAAAARYVLGGAAGAVSTPSGDLPGPHTSPGTIAVDVPAQQS